MGAYIIRRGEALRRGATDHELQRQCRTGGWTRLRPGAYATDAELAMLDAVARHRLLAEATLRAAAPDAVLSHQSAAAVHGLDMWNTPLQVVHLTRIRSGGGRRTTRRHVHSSVLGRHEITEVDGLRVTTVARTLLDLARTLGFEQALVAGDHALHKEAVTSAELESAVTAMPEHAGRRRVRRVFDLLDGRSESVGESRSRALFIARHLPIPEPQPNIYSDKGLHLGRVDLLLEEHHVIGEFDGRIKYGRMVPAGQMSEDVLWNEKVREDRLRDAGWQVVRWVWDELAAPSVVADRVTKAIARARKSPPPTGRVEHTPKP